MQGRSNETQGRYIISAAASLANCHPQTLRHYERLGLVTPHRTRGNIRLYTEEDIEHLRRIHRLMEDLGVNLAAVEVILHMREQIVRLRAEAEELQARLEASSRRREH
jgi:MerR family transcriptional regulator/heat shock protein HspR